MRILAVITVRTAKYIFAPAEAYTIQMTSPPCKNGRIASILARRMTELVHFAEIPEYAATTGNVELLQLAKQSGIKVDLTETIANSMANGHFNILMHIDDFPRTRPIISSMIGDNYVIEDAAIKTGDLRNLRWMVRRGFTPGKFETDVTAATYGQLHILKWIHKNYAMVPIFVLNAAIDNGHLHIVKWYKKIFGHINKYSMVACESALKNGQYEILEWLGRDEGDCTCKGCYHKKDGL